MNDQELLTRLASQFPGDGPPEKIWVACSGGLDSSALLLMLHMLQRAQPEFALGILHVNYGLRGAESDRDEAMVRTQAQRLGREVRVLKIDPKDRPGGGGAASGAKDSSHDGAGGGAATGKTGIQAWARTVRYEWFAREKGPRDWIAVAHHKDDWIETIFARLCRGHSLLALSGMQALHDGIWRPLLSLSRAQIKAWAEQHAVEFVEDSSNSSLDYTRNRLRHQMLPQLEQLFPGVGENLWVHAQDLNDTLTCVQSVFGPLPLGSELAYADLKERPAFLARHEVSRFLLAEIPTARVTRDLLASIYEALQQNLRWSSMLEPGSTAVCQKGVLRIEREKVPQNERWQQYRAALLDESLDVWPPGK